MSAPTFNRWGVKSATLTFGGTAYEMDVGKTGKSETKEAIDVTSLADTAKRFIAGALKETDEFDVTLFQSSSDLTVDTAPAALAIAVTLENGIDSDATASVSIAKAIITKVNYPDQSGNGDRKGTYVVTFRPDGSVAQV